MTLPQRRALVTGCAGFIGSHTTERLLRAGWHVVGVDNFDDYYPAELKRKNLEGAIRHEAFAFEECDLADPLQTAELARRYAFDAVVHLAAVAGVRLSVTHPARYVRANVVGTQNVLDAWGRQSGVRLVVASSSSVYGNDTPVPFVESAACGSPVSPYAATKRAAELLCEVAHRLHGGALTVLRFFTVYGPRQRPDLAIRKFSTAILRGAEISVYGDGSMARDFTHVDDIVRGVVHALDEGEGYRVVNLGNSSPVTVTELVRKLGTSLQKTPRVRFVPRPAGEMDVTYADISLAKRLWNWEPAVRLDDGLEDFATWLNNEESTSASP